MRLARKPSRVLRRVASASAATLALTAFGAYATAQTTAAESLAVLTQAEEALTGVIARCERAVVSITRTAEPPEGIAADPRTPQQRLLDRAQQPRIFIQGRQVLPAGLAALQQTAVSPSQASGAGVVIDPAGIVLTQYRVVKLGEHHVVTDVNGDRYLATIRAADPRSGLAVLAISKRLGGGPEAGGDPPRLDLPSLPLGQAEDLRKGRFVVAIGNPFSIDTDGQPTASWGTITNTALKAPASENLNDSRFVDGSYRTTLHHFGSLIQTDAQLGWNASGGALVTLDGHLVGVLTTAAAITGHEQPAGYAIPLNQAMRRAVATMREGLEPEYGLLGVNFNSAPMENRETGRRGIAVRTVFQGGPAHRAGLRANDLLLTIAGVPVTTPEALQLTVGGMPPGSVVPVTFERGGGVDGVEVQLGKAYIEEGQIVTRQRPAWRGLRVDYATAVPPTILTQKANEGSLDEEGCVVVSDVAQGSVSWDSGVRPYNFISHVSGKRVTTPDEFYAAVQDAEDNVKLKFTKPLINQPDGGGLN